MRIFLTLAGLFVFMIVFPQSGDDNKTRETYARNHIKDMVSWDYAYNGEKPGKTGIKTSLTLYSPSGDVAQVTTYNPKGLIINIEKYTYDDRGNKTEYSRFSGSTASEAAYQKISKYDNLNHVTEESGYDGVENFNNSYKYDDRGEMTEIRYMKNNVLSEKRIFSKNGSITMVSISNASGTITSKLKLKYDNRKNLIEEAVYGINQSELEKKTYNYDENKNLKEEAKYKLDKITLKTIYNYNMSGDILDISEEMPGSERFIKKSFSYDQGGHLLEIRWRRKDKEDFNSITYTYDARGLCLTANTWYPATKYRVLSKYTYDRF